MATNEREDSERWKGIHIDPTHLTNEEVQHECTIRGVYFAGLADVAQRAQLAFSFDAERRDNIDTITLYRLGDETENVQGMFDALLKTVRRLCNEFIDQVLSDQTLEIVPSITSRLLHYRLRILRFSDEQVNSESGGAAIKNINRCQLIITRMRPITDGATVNDMLDDMVPPSQLNSTTIQTATTSSATTENTNNSDTRPDSANAEQPLHATNVQTTESFRTSPHFPAYAAQTTPTCPRAVPLGVQFDVSSSNVQPQSIPANWSFGSNDLRTHSTQTSTAVTGANMGPIVTSQAVPSRPNHLPTVSIPLLLNESQLLGATHETSHDSSQLASNAAPGPRSTSYERSHESNSRPGSELQALKRWLGAKTFEGKLIDSKHFSVDEFLSHLRLCVQSGICAEEIMLKNLGPAFSGRAFIWWSTMCNRVHNFRQFTEQLKLRFATYAGSVEGLMASIYGRRQRKDEPLLDFVDDMQSLMDQLSDRFPDAVRISTIINCALPDESKLLRSRHYSDMADFSRHVALLSQYRPKLHIDRHEYKSAREKTINVCELESNSETSDDETESQLDVQAITTALQKAGFKFQRATKSRNETKKPKSQTEMDNKAKDQHSTASDMNARKQKVQCFGCGAPDTYYSNCVKCHTENKQKKREIYCFGCGTPNVYFTSCDSCQSKMSKNGQPNLTTATSQASAN